MNSNIDNLHFLSKHNYINSHSVKFHFDISNCKSILSIVNSYDSFITDNHKLFDEELIIVLATIRDLYSTNTLTTNQIIFKLSHNKQLLYNDYIINQSVKHIQGFIPYYCYFTCYDNTKQQIVDTIHLKTKQDKHLIERNYTSETIQNYKPYPICNSSNPKDDAFVIAMPYIQGTTMRKYPWNKNNIQLLRETIKSILTSYTLAFQYNGFIHFDCHLDNILLDERNNNIPIIIDFDKSFIHGDIHNFIQSILYFITNINNHIPNINISQTLKLVSIVTNITFQNLQQQIKHLFHLIDTITLFV